MSKLAECWSDVRDHLAQGYLVSITGTQVGLYWWWYEEDDGRWYGRMIHQNKIGVAPVLPFVDSLTKAYLTAPTNLKWNLPQSDSDWGRLILKICWRSKKRETLLSRLMRVLFCWVPVFFRKGVQKTTWFSFCWEDEGILVQACLNTLLKLRRLKPSSQEVAGLAVFNPPEKNEWFKKQFEFQTWSMTRSPPHTRSSKELPSYCARTTWKVLGKRTRA